MKVTKARPGMTRVFRGVFFLFLLLGTMTEGVLAQPAQTPVTFQVNDSMIKGKVLEGVGVAVVPAAGGDPVVKGVTGSAGAFQTSLAPGAYQVYLRRAGYVTIAGTGFEVGNEPLVLTNTMTMMMESVGLVEKRRIQVVLNWGEQWGQPRDLDAHLACSSQEVPPHIYYSAQNAGATDNSGTAVPGTDGAATQGPRSGRRKPTAEEKAKMETTLKEWATQKGYTTETDENSRLVVKDGDGNVVKPPRGGVPGGPGRQPPSAEEIAQVEAKISEWASANGYTTEKDEQGRLVAKDKDGNVVIPPAEVIGMRQPPAPPADGVPADPTEPTTDE